MSFRHAIAIAIAIAGPLLTVAPVHACPDCALGRAVRRQVVQTLSWEIPAAVAAPPLLVGLVAAGMGRAAKKRRTCPPPTR